jgi:hypothetical protein
MKVLALLVLMLAGASRVRADGFTLEGGLLTGYDMAAGNRTDERFGSMGLVGQAGYESRDWGFGVRGLNAFSNVTTVQIQAGPFNFSGSASRRLIQIGAFGRFFLHHPENERKSWYVELGFAGLQTDFLHADKFYVAPSSPGYTRIFTRGNGFSLGLGYRPKNGPWFYQFDYQLRRYESVLIEGEVNHIHQTIGSADFDGNYFIHAFQITAGLEIFGRN